MNHVTHISSTDSPLLERDKSLQYSLPALPSHSSLSPFQCLVPSWEGVFGCIIVLHFSVLIQWLEKQ